MILNISAKTKILIIALVVGVIIMVIISLVLNSFSPKDRDSSPESLPPTGLPIVIPDSNPDIEPTFKNYLTIELNDSSENLERLPDLVSKTDLPNGIIKYEYLSTYPGINNIIISQNQKVAFKSNVTVSSDNYKTPLIDTYTNTYGLPRVEFTGSEKYGRFAKTYIYPDQGFALIFNPVTREVYEVQSFNPVSLDEYIRQWGSDMKDYSKETPQPEF